MLLEALALAKNYCAIGKDEINTLVHCCKSVLIYNNCAWLNKDMVDNFNILQGSFHGVEVCKLVGLLILYEIHKKNIFVQIQFEIYTDNGLAILENKSDQIIKQLKKTHKGVQQIRLKINYIFQSCKNYFFGCRARPSQ